MKTNQTVTVKIEVSILGADKFEGHSSLDLNIPEHILRHLDGEKIGAELGTILNAAIEEYNRKNGVK